MQKQRLFDLNFDFYRRVPAQVAGSIKFEILNLVPACPVYQKSKSVVIKLKLKSAGCSVRKSNYGHIKVRR